MLVNFWASPEIRKQFEVSFSYKNTPKYEDGLKQRVQIDFPIYPLYFPEPSELLPISRCWHQQVIRSVGFLSRFISTFPILVYEIWILSKLFNRLCPDILHINNGGYPGALSARAAVIAAKIAGVHKVVMVVNNIAVGYQRPSRWLSYPVDRMIAHYVSTFVTGSTVAALQLKKVLHLNETKYHVIHNGITLRKRLESKNATRKRFCLDGFDGVIFGVVAILRPNKGHKVLLDAISKLLISPDKAMPNIKILIEGDGPLRADLKKIVSDNKLSSHCIFVGVEDNVIDFISFLDVLILPSVGN